MLIRNKYEMYEHLRAGKFGNINPHWFSMDEFLLSGYRRDVGIRSLTPGGTFIPNISFGCVRKMLYRHWPNGGYAISPMIPNTNLLINGEVSRLPTGLYLYYTEVKLPMRDSLRLGGKSVELLKAKMILEHYLDAPSYENIERLLDVYDGCTIEFSSFQRPVGTLKWNTIIWEVRHY